MIEKQSETNQKTEAFSEQPYKKKKSEVMSNEEQNNESQLIQEKTTENQDSKVKWNYLEHNGVFFPQQYKKKDLWVKYDGKKVTLNSYQEEIIIFWVQTFGSEFHANPHFKENFSKNFISSFYDTKNQLVEDNEKIIFDKFDFTNIQEYLENKKQDQKNENKEEKTKKKKFNEEIALKFQNAIIDHRTEKIGNFRIEPRSIFKGRGKHPKSGQIKEVIVPEDIVLNMSKHAKVPICQIPGRSWGEIVFKKDCAWIASWKEKCTDNKKYVGLAGSSKIKAKSDFEKFEKARELKKIIEKIRENYIKKMKSVSIKERQLGTATYIIDFLAIRAGNEKGDDKADTVGCCSLRKEHVILGEEHQVTFNFLGKDSIEYKNTVKVTQLAYENLKMFMSEKETKNQIFDEIDTSKLNEYLQSLMPGLTAKVFRTFNASNTLQQELDSNQKLNEKSILESKFEFYENSNKQVAILCNHQKGITKKSEESLQKLEEKIQEIKKEIKKEKSENKNGSKASKLKEKMRKLEIDLKRRQDKLGIATSTSKTNYNDPRITVAWCKKLEVPIEKIFTKVLLEKFAWAMPTKSTWKF